MTNESDWYRDHALLLSGLKEDGQPVDSAQCTETTQPKPEHHALPKRVGRFHVKRVIASGGMGTVYEAIQEHPRRSVAVKVMKHGVASRSAMRRFEYESQILGRLRHPGIAQIYDAGTCDDGSGAVPFFAMEYIPTAKPITGYAKEKKLSTRKRLELFAHVCDAVHHGHQKGIIHRDLKPSNILMDSDGQVKIIDFGVARGTDSDMALTTIQTGLGQLIGTLQYMSPEQCAADPNDLDIRSDVYALGVVLYELLSDKLPYDVSHKPIFESTRVIREQQPTQLSTADATLKGDTETIVLKALEKDRERRYQSANELARDIRCFLAGEAIAARPPSIVYQLRVFARRNKTAFAAIAAVFVVLVAASIISTSLYVRAERQRVRAAAAEQDQTRERQRAEANFQLAREAVDQMLTRVAEELKDRPHMEQVRRELLEDALAFYERFLEQQGDDAAVRFETGQACVQLGNINGLLGWQARAEADYARAIGIFEALAADSDKPEYSAALADVHSNLSHLLRTGDRKHGPIGRKYARSHEAEQHCRKAVAIHERLAAEFPKKPEYRQGLAGDLNELVILLIRTKRFTEAEEAQRQSQAVLEQLVAEFPDQPEYRNELAQNYIGLGALLIRTDRKAEADLAFRQALVLLEELVSEFPEEPEYRDELAKCLGIFGAWLRSTDPQAAEDSVRRAIEQHKQLAADFPGVPRYKASLSNDHNTLIGLLVNAKRYKEAEEHYRQYIAVCEELTADFPNVPEYRDMLVLSHGNLGKMLGNAGGLEGRRKRQEEAYRQFLALAEELLADFPEDPEYRLHVADALNNLGNRFEDTGRYQEGEDAFRRALSQGEELVAEFPTVPKYSNRLVMYLYNFGILLTDTGQYQEAEETYRRAIALGEELTTDYPAEHGYKKGLATALYNMSNMLNRLDRSQEAGDVLRRSLSLAESLETEFPCRHRVLLSSSLANLAINLATSPQPRVDDVLETLELAERAVELAPENGDLWISLGVVRYRAGDWEGAIEAQNKSVELGYVLDAMDLFFLAMAHWQAGDEQQARRTFDRAVQGMNRDQPDGPALLRYRAEAAELLGIEQDATEERQDELQEKDPG